MAELARSSSPREAILGVFEAAIGAAVVDGSRDGCLLINTALELSPHDPEVADIVARALTGARLGFIATVDEAGAPDGFVFSRSTRDGS